MSVYVDDYHIPYRGMQMSHMMADSTDELLAMVDLIGVQRKWLQKPGTYKEHFDIAKGKRELAIRHGAIPVSVKAMGAMVYARRHATATGPSGARQEVRRE